MQENNEHDTQTEESVPISVPEMTGNVENEIVLNVIEQTKIVAENNVHFQNDISNNDSVNPNNTQCHKTHSDFDIMTLEMLKNYCRNNNIRGYSQKNKKKLIEHIRNVLQGGGNTVKSRNIKSVKTKDVDLDIDSITAFQVSSKKENDSNNKIRERIVCDIINNKIPFHFYENSLWFSLRHAVKTYIELLMEREGLNEKIELVDCVLKAGRGNHYDLCIKINKRIFTVELKFNAEEISDAPQWGSPMHPSYYFIDESFEEYHYESYMSRLCQIFKIEHLPNKEVYMKQIHSPSPECMCDFQKKYYQGCKRSSKFTNNEESIAMYEECVALSKESIYKFIVKTELNIDKLNEWGTQTQRDKIYMLYKGGKFYYETKHPYDYQLVSYTKSPETSSYIGVTKSGKKLKILLRWKNGNGIAFPALQLS